MTSNTYRHKKTGGVYALIATGAQIESEGFDGEPQVVYVTVSNGQVWVRPQSEFFDGRFEPLS